MNLPSLALAPALVLALASTLPAADHLTQAQESLNQLVKLRATAVAALPAARQEMRLVLAGAADEDDVQVVLRRSAGAWTGGTAAVPGWSQGAMTEWRSFYLGNRGGNGRNDVTFAVDASALTWSGAALSGDLRITYRYDSPRALRLPAGELNNYWDRFVPSGNSVERQVVHHLDATVGPDSQQVEMILEDGVTWSNKPAKKTPTVIPPPTRAPVVIRFRLPSASTTPVEITTPGWFAGFHQADASGLVRSGNKISGKLVVYLGQDGWMPWALGKTWQAQFAVAEFTIDAQINNGVLSGTYAAAGRPGEIEVSSSSGIFRFANPLPTWSGKIIGRSGTLVVGRHATSGALGDAAGSVLGAVETEALPPAWVAPSAEAAALAQAGETCLADLRALALMRLHPGLPWTRARAQVDLVRQDWAEVGLDAVAGWLQKAVRWYDQPSPALPVAVAEGNTDSPSLGCTELKGELPAEGWHFVASWNVSDSVAMRSGEEQDSCPLAELVPSQRALIQSEDNLGTRRNPPARAEWKPLSASGPTVMLPEAFAPMFVRHANRVFFASGGFRLGQAGSVRLAFDAGDSAEAYVDGRLVWRMPGRSWRVRTCGRSIVTLDLAAGEHEVLLRCHRERTAPWVQVALSRAPARPGPTTKPISITKEVGDPPLAWKQERDTAWRLPELAGKRRPLALNGLLFVPTANGVTAVDPANGNVRWTSPLGKGGQEGPTPMAWDGDIIASSPMDGQVARLKPDGSVSWNVATGLIARAINRIGNLVILEGSPQGSNGVDKSIAVVTLDAGSGKVLNRWDLTGAEGGGAQGAGTIKVSGFDPDLIAVITLPGQDRLHATYLSSAGILIDVLDGNGTRRFDVDWPGQYDDGRVRYASGVSARATVCANGSDLVMAGQMGVALVRFWPGPDGRLAYGPRWMANGMNSGHGGFPAYAAVDGDQVFAWTVNPSHGPHCPDAVVECTAYDRTSGKVLSKQRRIQPGMARSGRAWVQFGRLHILEPGAEPFVMADNARLSILGATADLPVLGGGDLEAHSREPLALADRLIIRSPKGLYAIARHTAQRQAAARIVLDRLGQAPSGIAAPLCPALKKSELPAGDDLPITVLVDGLAPIRWLGLGPVEKLPADPTTLTPGGPGWRPLGRHEAWLEPTYYHRKYELQGTGDLVSLHTGRLDPAACAGPKASGLFAALIDNQHERMVMSRLQGPGLTVWLAGQKVRPGQAVRLAPGLHQVLVQVEPAWFNQKPETIWPPVDVVKGVANGTLKSLWNKTWKIAGPISADATPLEGNELKDLPGTTLAIGEATVPVHTVTDSENRLRLTGLVDLRPGQTFELKGQPATKEIAQPMVAYLFTEITAPADGMLYATASADWHMTWYLDGKRIYRTAPGGNEVSPDDLGGHPFAVPIKAGRHVVAVDVKPGSKGWQLRADLAFSDQPFDRLATIAAKARYQATAPELRLDPAFTFIPQVSERLIAWRNHARPLRSELRQIVTDLPNTDESKRASLALAALGD